MNRGYPEIKEYTNIFQSWQYLISHSLGQGQNQLNFLDADFNSLENINRI